MSDVGTFTIYGQFPKVHALRMYPFHEIVINLGYTCKVYMYLCGMFQYPPFFYRA